MEDELRADASQLHPRVKLIGYYSSRRDAESIRRYHDHVLYQVRFHPSVDLHGFSDIPRDLYPEAFERIHLEWKRTLSADPANQTVIDRALLFHIGPDPEFALGLIHRGLRLNSTTPMWFARLALWHQLHSRAGAPETLDALKRAVETSLSPPERAMYLITLARAQRSVDLDAAGVSAEAALACDPNPHPYVTHFGNIILGLRALKGGRVNDSVRHLMASCGASETSILEVYGPDLELANALLSNAQNDAVLIYLEQCVRLSPSHKTVYQSWAQEIASQRRFVLQYDDLVPH